jgi:hypothetical protein
MIMCKATTLKGNPCSITERITDEGFCHVHDPKGVFQTQHTDNKRSYKRELWEKRIREQIILDLEAAGLKEAVNIVRSGL